MPELDQQAIREQLHVLLDRIPDSDVPTAQKFLRALADPLKTALHYAPLDSEPMSDRERAAWEADQKRRERGEPPVSADEVLGDLGLLEEDLR
jgi:hypothetical protein